MAIARQSKNPNLLLDALSPPDLARLRPHLSAIKLKLLHKMEIPDKPIEDIYFMHEGIASVVAVQPNGGQIEIGLVGNEGATGCAVMLGNDRSPHSTYIQIAGSGERMPAKELRKAMEDSATLRSTMLDYVQSFMVQTAHTAIANIRGKLPERLARWLLMAHDRVDGNTLPLTHEFLSLMLGVRRAGVTEAVQNLKQKNLIQAARGMIEVLDRKGIERLAGGFYGVPEQEYQRLLG
jgi:CRP-like cAMP-binding protein